MAQTPGDSDLLVQFERDNIKDDYRVFYAIKRNNLFSSIQSFPEHWEFFCRLDEIWRREIGNLEVATDPDRMLPVILYMNAHAKMRISMELAFSHCMPEARSILRDAVENVAHAHHMLRDPANQLIWLKKDEPSGKKAFKKVFEEDKKNGLFSGINVPEPDPIHTTSRHPLPDASHLGIFLLLLACLRLRHVFL
jgi:hypothetical protein